MLADRVFWRHGKEALLVSSIVHIVWAATVGFSSLLAEQATRKPLSKEEVIKRLEGDVSPRRVETEARELGIDFEITWEVEKELRDAGADDGFVVALRDLSRKRPVQSTGTVMQDDAALQPTLSSSSGNVGPTGAPSCHYLAVSHSHVGWITISNGVFHFGEKGDKWAIESPLTQLTDVNESKFSKPHGFWHMTDTLNVRTSDGLRFHFLIQNAPGQPDLGDFLRRSLGHNR
jgi:hypothetical protein